MKNKNNICKDLIIAYNFAASLTELDIPLLVEATITSTEDFLI